MTEGDDLYIIPRKWVQIDEDGGRRSIWLGQPVGAYYRFSGEALEALLVAAGYQPDE